MAAALFAVDPAGLGGVVLRSGAGPLREAWLASLVALLPADAPHRRVPLHIDADRLLGGLDLAATLRTGRPVALRGLLAEADGGIVVLAMAERVASATAAALAAVMDAKEVVVERSGISMRNPSRIGVVAFDEGLADDEQVPARLAERLAFHLRLGDRCGADDLPGRAANGDPVVLREDIAEARARLAATRIGDAILKELCAVALALGVDSPRATLFACRAARAAAALEGRVDVDAADATLAAALVLAPRATRLPPAAEQAAEVASTDMPEPAAQTNEKGGQPDDMRHESSVDDDQADAPPEQPHLDRPPRADDDRPVEPRVDESQRPDLPATNGGLVDDQVLEAALAAIPRGLLASLALGHPKTHRNPSAGRSGAAQLARLRGRPLGARRAGLQGGARLNLMETLRTAAPWQSARKGMAIEGASSPVRQGDASHRDRTGARIVVLQEDFRVWRFRQRSETTTLFVVDASGSAALHRLAETKGAVELLLADCYVRRDSVAVIAFRGAGAELLLSPTRSLLRAKRSLAGLPGGGGTPLAAGIASAVTLVEAVRRRGATPVVVLLTDGRANIARDGTPGRAKATDDALAAAKRLRLHDVASLLLDTSPQAQEPARRLAAAMGARYLPLPYAAAQAMSQAVRTMGAAKPPAR